MRRGVLALVAVVFTFACESSTTGPTSPSRASTPAPSAAPTPVAAPPPQAVTHTLIMTASPSCTTLADAAKRRTYPAQFQQKPDGNLVVLVVNSTDIMIGWANDSGFTGKRDGSVVRFDITDDIFAPYAMIERIPEVGDVGFEGVATGTIDGQGTVVAAFSGDYRVGYPPRVLCHASDHVIEIAPVGG